MTLEKGGFVTKGTLPISVISGQKKPIRSKDHGGGSQRCRGGGPRGGFWPEASSMCFSTMKTPLSELEKRKEGHQASPGGEARRKQPDGENSGDEGPGTRGTVKLLHRLPVHLRIQLGAMDRRDPGSKIIAKGPTTYMMVTIEKDKTRDDRFNHGKGGAAHIGL